MLAVVIAVATWGAQLHAKQILIHCDNMAVCHILKKGTSKNELIMDLVRLLFYFSAFHNLLCSAEYIWTHDNNIADIPSRFQYHRFRSLVPQANVNMTEPYPVHIHL